MKFIFADGLDMIDPKYDFIADRPDQDRDGYWSDQYPHEYFRVPPYDGVLISRGIVGDDLFPGKYTNSMAMRFRRIGARAFLRMTDKRFAHLPIFGDCGAFSYADENVPPYTTDMMLDFYADGKFSHGCSVDHIIFDFDANVKNLKGGSTTARKRFNITLDNAADFLRGSKQLGRDFTPLGVVQGWSPASMGEAARQLEKMGYKYLAIGGLVPLRAEQIHLCLREIREKVSPSTKLHLLGFAKADQIYQFIGYRIASFDTTSPLTRAFKDARANYYSANGKNTLEYHTAIRVPHPTENKRLKKKAKSKGMDQEELSKLDQKALRSLRDYDCGRTSLERCVDAVMTYSREFLWIEGKSTRENRSAIAKSEEALRRTLSDRPWKKCKCRVCRESGIETIIFRGSNRNKRRGFHNLQVFYKHFKKWVL